MNIIAQTQVITQETLEFLAQQNTTTQLMLLVFVVILVGGTIAFLTLRGGLKVFEKISTSIDNQAIAIKSQTEVTETLDNTEKARWTTQQDMHETQKELVQTLIDFRKSFENKVIENEARGTEIIAKILGGIDEIKRNVDELREELNNSKVQTNDIMAILAPVLRDIESLKTKTDEIHRIRDEQTS